MRPSIQHLLDGLTGAAAYVHNARLDNLAANQFGYALYADMFSRAAGPGPLNSTRYVFRDPYDRDLSDLVGELSTQRAEFRTRWDAHNVCFHDTGSKDFHHPVVGHLTLTYNRMELAADPGQMLMMVIYQLDRAPTQTAIKWHARGADRCGSVRRRQAGGAELPAIQPLLPTE
ncbi:MAG TPA: hypothetical protein VJ140_18345 [Actinomycetota bacterium]|nr:hypothetical protein [Actinomycetota bacterium]